MRYAITQDGTVLDIDAIMAMAPTDRPTALRCAGRLPDGTPCLAQVSTCATEDHHLMRPYLRARPHHRPGCDEDGEEHTPHRPGIPDGSTTPRTRRTGPRLTVITTTPAAATQSTTRAARPRPGARPMATAVPTRRRTSNRPTATNTTLSRVLRRLLAGSIPDDEQIALPGGPQGTARSLIRPLAHATAHDVGTRACYWGFVTDDPKEYPATGSVFIHAALRPRHRAMGAAVMVTAAQAGPLQDHLRASIGDLRGHWIMVIGTLHQARSGRLHIELDDPSSLAHQH